MKSDEYENNQIKNTQDENEMLEKIREDYTKKQLHLREITLKIIANPTAKVLEENFAKLSNLIEVD